MATSSKIKSANTQKIAAHLEHLLKEDMQDETLVAEAHSRIKYRELERTLLLKIDNPDDLLQVLQNLTIKTSLVASVPRSNIHVSGLDPDVTQAVLQGRKTVRYIVKGSFRGVEGRRDDHTSVWECSDPHSLDCANEKVRALRKEIREPQVFSVWREEMHANHGMECYNMWHSNTGRIATNAKLWVERLIVDND